RRAATARGPPTRERGGTGGVSGPSTRNPRLLHRSTRRLIVRCMAASAAALAMLDPPAALAQGSAVAPPRAEPMASASMNAPDMAPVARGSDAASVELDRLETLLKHYQAEEESHGLWSGLSGIALGGAIAPLGLVIYNRTQRQSLVGPLMFVVGVGLFAGG